MLAALAGAPVLARPAAPASSGASQSTSAAPAATVTIHGIEVNGLKRLSPDQVIALSGLRTGQPFDAALMQTSIDRLIAVGIFANVRCRYDVARGGLVVFDIEEHAWTRPVVFDNFIWWTDAELTRAIAEAVPTFDGTAPQTDAVIHNITVVLERLMRERHAPGEVAYYPSMRPDGSDRKHRFRIRGVALPICGLHFPRASGIAEAELVRSAAAIAGKEYLQEALRNVIHDTLLPLYGHRGFVEARAGQPETRYVSTAACPSGVDVSVPIEEGIAYRMGTVTAPGLSDRDARALMQGWKLKPGKPYDGFYLADYLRSAPVTKVRAANKARTLSATETRNPPGRTVDVAITLK